MNEISLPENSCPLCDLDGVKSTPYSIDRGRYYLCPNCGPFSISEIAYMLIRGTNNEDIKAKISFHIKHNSNNQKPIFLTRDYFRDVIETIIMPSVSEQLNNLLSWLGEKSNSSLETVQGNVEHLVAYVGCKNSKQVIQLLDQLWEDNLIIMELPTTGPLRERAYFKKFATHLTRLGIEKIEQNKKSDIFTFNIPTLTVENFLLGGEGNDREIKGSFRLDLNHLLKGGGKNETKENIAKEGVLKTLVGFLNSKGGNILIGAIEKNNFSADHLSKIRFKDVRSYYIIGIQIEKKNLDHYELDLRNVISSSISKELVDLVEITFPTYDDFSLCQIKVNKASNKWYYLDSEKFFVRDGNRTIELRGSDADDYKKRNAR